MTFTSADTVVDAPPLMSGGRHRLMWQSQLPKAQTYVYFIQGEPGTEVKIGFTNEVGQRLRALQTGNPKPLRELAVVPAPRSVETAYHRLLGDERGLGEWFAGPNTDRLLLHVLDVAERMVHSYDGSGLTPDIYEFDDLIERPQVGPMRPQPKVEPEDIQVIPVPPKPQTPLLDRSVKSRLRAVPERPDPLPEEGDRPWRGKLPDWAEDGFRRRSSDFPPPFGRTEFT